MATVLKRIGSYEILKKLGRGGMADVYLARDARENRLVALKLIEQSEDPEGREMMAAEKRGAILQVRLSEMEPCVAKINNYGEIDGHFYIDMEYIEGVDLSELIRQGPLPPRKAVEIAAEVCRALARAHSFETTIDGNDFHGIIHGDIKPGNIRIDPEGRVRLLDFGIAKALSLSRKLTRNEFGSLPYSSPERLDTGAFDKQSDLWAVGVVLFETISGRPPFQAENTRKLENLIRGRTPVAAMPESCPEPLRRIVTKALVTDPSLRYQSAEEFKSDLDAFLEGQPTKAESEAAMIDDATRRTFRRTDDLEATRRTVTQREPAASSAAAERSPRYLAYALLAVFLAGVLLAAIHEGAVWLNAREVEQQLRSGQISPDDAWTRYQALSERSYLEVGTEGLRRELKAIFLGRAQQILNRSNPDGSQPDPQQWSKARDYLYRAYELDPRDKEILSKIVHLEVSAANESLKKEELGDPSQLENLTPEESLRRSQAIANQLAEPERVQFAGAFRDRADQLWFKSREASGAPNEPDYLVGARRAYQQAVLIYKSVQSTPEIEENIRGIEGRLGEIQSRLSQIFTPEPSSDAPLPSDPDAHAEKIQQAEEHQSRGSRLVAQADEVAGTPQEQEYLLQAGQAFQQALDIYHSLGPAEQFEERIRPVKENLATVQARLNQIKQRSQPSP